MAAITDSIGTLPRDFTTISSWEVSLSAHSGDDVTGECYDDSDFDEALTLDDQTPDSVVLSVASGERHNGTAKAVSGSGVRNLCSIPRQWLFSTDGLIVEWIEHDHNGLAVASYCWQVNVLTTSDPITVRNCIIHDSVDTGSSVGLIISDPTKVFNVLVYDLVTTASDADSIRGIRVYSSDGDLATIYNCTVDNITNNNGSGGCAGISVDDDNANKNVLNCIATRCGGTTSGYKVCFYYTGVVNSTFDYCLDDDSSLPSGLNNQRGKSAANQYVSTVQGSQNYHLKAGADALTNGIGPALDSNVPATDIDDDARSGDTCDIGMDESDAVDELRVTSQHVDILAASEGELRVTSQHADILAASEGELRATSQHADILASSIIAYPPIVVISGLVQQQPDGEVLRLRGDLDVDVSKITSSVGDLILEPGETGALRAEDTGDKRGKEAVDLQRTRTASSQVASGLRAVISGGENNSALDNCTVVGGGSTNTTEGIYATIGGGWSNWTQTDYATISGGGNNNVNGDYSTICGGLDNTVTQTHGFIGGGTTNNCGGNYSVICGGTTNNIVTAATASFIGGGTSHAITAIYSTIGGGNTNSITGDYSAIGGGINNSITCLYGTIAGGNGNDVDCSYCGTICGGTTNNVASDYGTIGGGLDNVISSAYYGTIGGGSSNVVAATYGTISGGWDNNTTGNYATISGGRENDVASEDGTVGGGSINNVYGTTGTIGGGSNNTVAYLCGTIAGGYYNTVDQEYGFIGGGNGHSITGPYGTISGGTTNSVVGSDGTIGGGSNNSVDYEYGTVCGGYYNGVGAGYGFVGGGYYNVTSGNNAVACGGSYNYPNADHSTIGGGASNNIYSSGNYSTICGGYYNETNAEFATVMGTYAKSDLYGQVSQASGDFASAGDAQTSVLTARNQTTDATQTAVFLDGSSIRLVVPADSSWLFNIHVLAHRDTHLESAGYQLQGVVRRQSTNTPVIVGTRTKTVLCEDDSSWDADVQVNATYNDLEIVVTGASKNISWVARIELTIIKG